MENSEFFNPPTNEDMLPYNTRVEFSLSEGVVGTGRIVGVATMGVPVLGKNYIIEPDRSIQNEVYKYTHFVCPEAYFKVLG